MAEKKRDIHVYAHWASIPKAELMGILSANSIQGKEIFSFSYNDEWLRSENRFLLDPELQNYTGPQYLNTDKPNFGIFSDSAPDRWGRLLIKRKKALEARQLGKSVKPLYESDYLLGVYDANRMGGLRFKTDPQGDFLDNDSHNASPPWTSIRELEQASLHLEEDGAVTDPHYNQWLNALMAPGSSLGGARPKAGVVDNKDNLWIAKFPSKNDSKDSGAWEMIARELAVESGIEMAESKAECFSNSRHTFLTKRFDRTPKGERIHFASAMTMLGYKDGADSAMGASYLEIAEFLIRFGAEPEKDLTQLWRRIVLNICLSNTDDHLRNHGFLLTDRGWKLSPAYDINPEPEGYGLSLNITESENSLDTDLALGVAPYFRLSRAEGKAIVKEIKTIIRKWPELADKYRITRSEKEQMSPAFNIKL